MYSIKYNSSSHAKSFLLFSWSPNQRSESIQRPKVQIETIVMKQNAQSAHMIKSDTCVQIIARGLKRSSIVIVLTMWLAKQADFRRREGWPLHKNCTPKDS